ncbi:MAG TPA: NAD-dependent epimerase/dehydratase family protein [Candidatus Elarobacter sp.]|nr:NAD-dependent epimerase/dehydratase family protein [Candidatus Elarobacter sp.]
MLGAGGFLGGALASALCDDGAVVEGFGHPPRDAGDADDRVRWTIGEFEDEAAVARALSDQEVLFLLGPSTGDLAAPDAGRVFSAHVAWTVRLLDAARRGTVRRVVFASSGGAVYGEARRIPTPESETTKPISAYGSNRVAIERYLELHRLLFGLDYRVVRIANCYGPGQSPLRRHGFVAVALHRAMHRRPIELWGADTMARDFVYVDDAARAMVHVARHEGTQRVFNAGSGVGRTLNAVVRDVARLAGVREPAVMHEQPRRVDVSVSVLDTTLIRTLTSWRPRVAWPDGLAETARWMRRRYPA